MICSVVVVEHEHKHQHQKHQHQHQHEHQHAGGCHEEASDDDPEWKLVVTPTGKEYEIPRPLVCPPAPCKRKKMTREPEGYRYA
jgi:hypothetical protein